MKKYLKTPLTKKEMELIKYSKEERKGYQKEFDQITQL